VELPQCSPGQSAGLLHCAIIRGGYHRQQRAGAYAAANTFLDAFTLHRRQKGLAASSLDLTAVEGIGYLAETADMQLHVLKNLSGNTICESEVLALVEAAIAGKVDNSCHG
jgi:KR domain